MRFLRFLKNLCTLTLVMRLGLKRKLTYFWEWQNKIVDFQTIRFPMHYRDIKWENNWENSKWRERIKTWRTRTGVKGKGKGRKHKLEKRKISFCKDKLLVEERETKMKMEERLIIEKLIVEKMKVETQEKFAIRSKNDKD